MSTSHKSARVLLIAAVGTAAAAPAAHAMPPEHESAPAPIVRPAPANQPSGGLDWIAVGGAAAVTLAIGASGRVVLRRRSGHAAIR